MHTLEFTLKQHTPIIHFQHDQDGATLRASELKPKLDRFIIKRQGDWDQIHDSWRVGRAKGVEDQHALDYKVRISIDPKSTLRWYPANENRWTWPCFFANMGGENQGKYKLCCVDGAINLSIKTDNDELAEKITSSICSFFSNNTFASRQSKGFGAFFPLPSSPAFGANSCYKRAVKKYRFDVNISDQIDFWGKKKKVFDHIDLFYRLLRSGINRKTRPLFVPQDLNGDGQNEWLNERGTRFYCKPVLFLYLKDNGIQWDKKTIKQHFFNDKYYNRTPDGNEQDFLLGEAHANVSIVYDRGLPQQIVKYANSDVLSYSQTDTELKLWRDLMGLSSLEEWRSYGNKMRVSKTHAKLHEGNWVPRAENDPENIHRFKSPFGFLPIFADDNKTCTVYFSSESIPKSYRDSHFIVGKMEKNSLKIIKSEVPLQIGDLESLDPLIEWLLTPGKFSLKSNWLGDKKTEYDALTQVLNTLKRVPNV